MLEIKKKDERLAVYNNGVQQQHGFTRYEDALHAIWIDSGANPEHFYNVDKDGKVTCDITPFNQR